MASQNLNADQQQALDDALLIAADSRDLDMMKSAMDSGANPDVLLFRGIRSHELAWVEAAVAHGANVNAKMPGLYDDYRQDRPYPPFHWVARFYQDEKIGDFLLSRGAQIDARGLDYNSALMDSIVDGRLGAAAYLASRGADALLLCNGDRFPLKELERANYDTDTKRKLVKLMLAGRQKAVKGATPSSPASQADAANDSVATTADIRVGPPLEIHKKKPHSGGLEL
jgi:ankyrin repeat protein